MISFNSIPSNILVPGAYTEFDNSQAQQGLTAARHRILIIAPRLNTGNVAALTPTRVRSAAEGESFFGRGSIGAAMVAASKRTNNTTDTWMIGVADAGGAAAASGTLTVTGPATAAGTVSLYIAGKRIQAGVASGATASQVASAIEVAIAADTSLPVSASVADAVVTLTARNAGLLGNDIDVRLNYNFGEALPAGIAIAVVAMSGGTGAPDMTTVTAALGDTQYNTIVCAFNDATALAVLETWLLQRWTGTMMKEGHVHAAKAGSYATYDTFVAARNSPFTTVWPVQGSPTPSWIIATDSAAQDASQCADITNVNRSRISMMLPNVLPPAESARYSWSERQQLLTDGGATWTVDDGGVCRIERMVTTYKTFNGQPDTTYQDTETMRGLAYLRYDYNAFVVTMYSRYKLANNGQPIAPGSRIATPNSFRDSVIARAVLWFEAGLIEDLEQFKREILVERNATDRNRLDCLMRPNMTNNLLVIATQVQFVG